MGYEGVDFAGYYGFEAKDIRRMLDDLGLGVAGCHTGIDTLMGDELARTVEFNATLGGSTPGRTVASRAVRIPRRRGVGQRISSMRSRRSSSPRV